MAAEEAQRKKDAEELAVQSALNSKVEANPEEEVKHSGAGSKAKLPQEPENIDGLPEDMVCCICTAACVRGVLQSDRGE